MKDKWICGYTTAIDGAKPLFYIAGTNKLGLYITIPFGKDYWEANEMSPEDILEQIGFTIEELLGK
jgi:hypothetical protein